MNVFMLAVTASCCATVLASTPSSAFGQIPAMPRSAASPFGISMDRMGSGTTWIPDAVPIPSAMFAAGSWDLMLHGFVVAQYNEQRGRRGDSQFGSLNWGMLMAGRELFGGRLQARTMLSLDPATVTNKGYPLLMQSGETYRGNLLVDRQHPHDFFMELGVLYERGLTSRVGMSLYAAPSGEPALSPVAFMHRPSGMEMPTAPLGHHWQDATHISFGVLTAGVFTRSVKLEASVFNGREPNEHRWDFDRIRFDSYSGRLTLQPGSRWSFTAGYGFLESPEVLEPDESMHRVTASALFSRRIGSDGEWASSAIWGANKHSGESMTHSALLESRLSWSPRNTVFGRVERVTKTAHELAVEGLAGETRLDVSAVSLGYIRELYRGRGVSIGIGGMGTVNVVPQVLEGDYGSTVPAGWLAFIRLRPIGATGVMNHAGMQHGQ